MKINNPMITTVIPTYRRPGLLKRAIESALMQSYKDIRVCVYDNASGDDTKKIVNSYALKDSRITYYRNEKNIGAVENMRKGVAAVETPYYSLLNDDDFLLPDFYHNAMLAVKDHPDALFFCAKTITIDLIGNTFMYRNKGWAAGVYQPSIEVVDKMYHSHFTQTGVLLHTKMRDQIGCFEASGDDWLYQTIASSCASFVVLDYYGAVYTLHEETFTTTEGLRNSNFQIIKEQFLDTLAVCMNLNIPAEIKSYITMIVVKSYAHSFDKLSFNQYLNDQINFADSMPSLLTKQNFINSLYGRCPQKLHRVISLVIRAGLYILKIKQTFFRSDFKKLPGNAIKFFESKSTDIKLIEKSFAKK